ncbi:hypothetical protein ACJIZ3_017753 [Penstemon smallii]|uniref:Uncharacterized protein n=1 Tax=Penstemon smallii TaxID=265156 RepID=A0ABD3SWE9_9LAMI
MAFSASTTVILRNPMSSLSHHHPTAAPYSRLLLPLSTPKPLSFYPLPKPLKSRISASISPALKNPNPAQNLLSGSTRTVTSLLAIAITSSKFFAHRLFTLKEPLLYTVGPAFFAAIKNVPTGSLNTPFTVVAAGMAKWLDLYSGVLMVRVLLSWFPNIPWDRQPLSAIRDLCDPYLNLFRNIIPPIFDTLDVSPLLAFAVLGTLGSILNSSRGAS